jgi:hypothetical protein
MSLMSVNKIFRSNTSAVTQLSSYCKSNPNSD